MPGGDQSRGVNMRGGSIPMEWWWWGQSSIESETLQRDIWKGYTRRYLILGCIVLVRECRDLGKTWGRGTGTLSGKEQGEVEITRI